MIPSEPKKLDMPFAYEGGRNEIPTTGGEDTGNASLSQGFPYITQQPLSQGGIPPQRKDFNGILYALSAHTHYQQSGGMYSWDETLDYIQNCIVTYNGSIYICLATNGANTTAGAITPGTNTNYWQTLYSFLQSGDTGSVGSSTNPVYVSNGKMVASTASVGGTAQPVRLNNGVITALTATVGASDTPVYLRSGVLTACTGITGGGVSEYKLGNPGYVKFECGFIVQWGRQVQPTYTSPLAYTVTFPISFSSATSYTIVKNGNKNLEYWVSGWDVPRGYTFYNQTATGATSCYITSTGGSTRNEYWLAIGY